MYIYICIYIYIYMYICIYHLIFIHSSVNGHSHCCIFFLNVLRMKGPHCSDPDNFFRLHLQQQPGGMRSSLALRQRASLLASHYKSGGFLKCSLPALIQPIAKSGQACTRAIHFRHIRTWKIK